MDTQPPSTPNDHSALRCRRLALLWAVATAALIGVTWPLWTGQTSLPSIPALSVLLPVPQVAEYLLLGGVVWGVLCVLRGRQNAGLIYGCLGVAGLMLLDQLRWQPWAYHLLILAFVLLAAPPRVAVRSLRWLAVSVYLYSAIAKLDYTFATTLGRQMLEAAAGLVGVDPGGWPRWLVISIALAMPVLEAVVGLLLVFRKTRRVGLVLATAMHLSAIVALGPLGLNHRPGVLLWNVVFPAHLWLLFGPVGRGAEAATDGPAKNHGRPAWGVRLAMGVVGLAIIGPLTRPLGVWDRWPSWGLYAPGGERTEVLVRQSVVDRLPDTLLAEEIAGDTQTAAGWRRLRLDEWSLHESMAPLYPQRRTILALARKLDKDALLGNSLQVELLTPADRFTGQRDSESLQGIQPIEEYSGRYWLNTRVRTRR